MGRNQFDLICFALFFNSSLLLQGVKIKAELLSQKGCLTIGCWLLAVGMFNQLKILVILLPFNLAEKASCLWRYLVNLSIGCWLYINEKVDQQVKSQSKKLADQQVKSQSKKLAGAAFSFWLKSQFFSFFKSHLSNTFFQLFDQPINHKPKAKS